MDYYELGLQRRQQIEEGLLELLRTKAYEKISVTDIAAHMGMSRKSFYKYFSGKDDCLMSLFDRVIQEAALHVTSCTAAHEEDLVTWQEYLRFWQSQRTLLEVVASRNLERLLIQRYMHYNQTEERYSRIAPDLPLHSQDEDVLRFYLTGIVTLLLCWCQRGFTPGVEEMAAKCHRLCRFG